METLVRDRRVRIQTIDGLLVLFGLLPVIAVGGRYLQTWSDARPADLAAVTLAAVGLSIRLLRLRLDTGDATHPDAFAMRRHAARAATFAVLTLAVYANHALHVVFPFLALAGGSSLLSVLHGPLAPRLRTPAFTAAFAVAALVLAPARPENALMAAVLGGAAAVAYLRLAGTSRA